MKPIEAGRTIRLIIIVSSLTLMGAWGDCYGEGGYESRLDEAEIYISVDSQKYHLDETVWISACTEYSVEHTNSDPRFYLMTEFVQMPEGDQDGILEVRGSLMWDEYVDGSYDYERSGTLHAEIEEWWPVPGRYRVVPASGGVGDCESGNFFYEVVVVVHEERP